MWVAFRGQSGKMTERQGGEGGGREERRRGWGGGGGRVVEGTYHGREEKNPVEP